MDRDDAHWLDDGASVEELTTDASLLSRANCLCFGLAGAAGRELPHWGSSATRCELNPGSARRRHACGRAVPRVWELSSYFRFSNVRLQVSRVSEYGIRAVHHQSAPNAAEVADMRRTSQPADAPCSHDRQHQLSPCCIREPALPR